MIEYQPLNDAQWQALETLFPKPVKRKRGKPHTPWRAVVNSILWIVFTKAKWGLIPKTPDYASKSAAHRWYLSWKKSGKIEQILEILRSFHPGREISLPPQRTACPFPLFEQTAVPAAATAL